MKRKYLFIFYLIINFSVFGILTPKVVLGNRQNEVGELQFEHFKQVEANLLKCRALAFKSNKNSLFCAFVWLGPFYVKKMLLLYLSKRERFLSFNC